jgi:hypothetical protein
MMASDLCGWPAVVVDVALLLSKLKRHIDQVPTLPPPSVLTLMMYDGPSVSVRNAIAAIG